MQIVRGGKVSWLHDLLVIHGKIFAIVQQFETPYNKKEKNLLENLRDWRLIHENHESFPPRTICIIRYLCKDCMASILQKLVISILEHCNLSIPL